MREILFRAKRIDNGEWVEGLPIKMWGLHIQNSEDENTDYKIDLNTICQYTDLLDKNGSKIFEGDICIIKNGILDEEDGYFLCEWDDDAARFCLSGNGITADFDNCYGHDCEVIGNIFDNPGLLEEQG